MKKNNVYILEDRGLLYVSGEDCKEFLQNIVTNNINKVDDKNSCYSALLTPQHPSKPLSFAKSEELSGVAPK